MNTDDDAAAKAEAQENPDFEAGFPSTPDPKPADTATPAKAAKPDAKPAATPRAAEEPAVEYVQISKKDWEDVRAAATRTASYDQQFSKAFGTIGNLQKLVQALQGGTPRGGKLVIPKEAFTEMEKDFPELANHTRTALEAALSGLTGTGATDADPAKFETMMADYTRKRELEALEDAHPDWRQIVGAVDATTQQPDPNHPFRKWLATQPAAYQKRLNDSESCTVISRAISRFQQETKAPPKPAAGTPRNNARAERIADAVQPRGDRGRAPAAASDEDEFLAGFGSR